MAQKKGLFLTLEGLDGAGKSTHVPWLVEELSRRNVDVLNTREPGGTPLGEQLRQILLHQPMTLKAETLLMFAARAEHVETVIRPALDQGRWVLCDRFTDATFAYQGGGRQLGGAAVNVLESWLHPDLQPDCTWFFDVPLNVARERLAQSRDLDRFEQEGADFFERTRAAYHLRAREFPNRVKVVDSARSIADIQAELVGQVDDLLVRWRSA
ncbi:MAG TPA: dTMP kinase [Pusillimonas sp.]|jgi:dTMP kinase|nr:dTMP kinase [Pusillimonas sp.]MBC43524.1 dTMP kinase [Pusillimonas sp.]HBT33611.1 dTMP kinase [Pusillimonas sp.]HCN72395.1 dTMP kinase [Pusillimonas sp.]|tara:strand:+ start:33702 stop:34337 length:636 start_codon:yes stop_codon:yes gene_type:complete